MKTRWKERWKVTVGETRQKADPRVLEMAQMAIRVGYHRNATRKEGKHPLFRTYSRRAFRTVNLFGGIPSRRKNIFRFPIRRSSHQSRPTASGTLSRTTRIYVKYARLCASQPMSFSVIPHPFLLHRRLTMGYRSAFASSCLPSSLSPSVHSHDSSLFFIRIL